MLDDEKFLEEVINGKRIKRNNPKPQQTNNEHYKDDFQIICDNLKALETDLSDTVTESEGNEIFSFIRQLIKLWRLLWLQEGEYTLCVQLFFWSCYFSFNLNILYSLEEKAFVSQSKCSRLLNRMFIFNLRNISDWNSVFTIWWSPLHLWSKM